MIWAWIETSSAETGCGKSTLARCAARLLEPTGGRVLFDGADISHLSAARMRPLRRNLQMIFQDPFGSLNPRRRVGAIIGDPFAIHGIGGRLGRRAGRAERRRQVQELMELVGLNPEHYNRFPAEFSGGQRPRIGVARALAFRPKLVICDEPVSALDVSVQATIINLLADLNETLNLSMIFVSHNMAVVRQVSDRTAVMYQGRIVERGPTSVMVDHPEHPYTQALMSSVLAPEPKYARTRIEGMSSFDRSLFDAPAVTHR